MNTEPTFSFDFDDEDGTPGALAVMPQFDLDSSSTQLRPEPAPVASVAPEQGWSNWDESASLAPSAIGPLTSAGESAGVLYVDIETIPDYERQHLFNLPAPPATRPEQGMEELLTPAELLSQTLKEIETYLSQNNPCDEWLEAVYAAERNTSGKKGNRKGLFDALDDCRKAKSATDDALRKNRKIMATTPEMLKIVAIGLAIDDEPVISGVDGLAGATETSMLQAFWQGVRSIQQICGFNLVGFDLPAIFFRSMLLGVPASRRIDTSPHRGQVIDLQIARFGKYPEKGMGLKNVAKLCHIDVPCEGVDGSQVEELMNVNPHLVAQYVASDIVVTRKLHRLYSSYFC